MYVVENYKSKKDFLLDVKRLSTLQEQATRTADEDAELGRLEARLQVWTPGPFGVPENGTGAIEGPHAPKPHKWYAAVTVKNGVVVKVRS